jgi:hypothetical protein
MISFGFDMHVGNVIDLFVVSKRGVIILTDKACHEWPRGLVVKIGQLIELHQSGRCVLKTHIAGIDAWGGKPVAFLLPPDVAKQDVPIGAEVWVTPPTIPHDAASKSVE